MNEPKKEEIFSVEMKLDPIDAGVVLKNIGGKVNTYHGLIEEKDLEFIIEVRKANSIGIIFKILGVAADIEGTTKLIGSILWFLRGREEKAKIAERKFEFSVKTNKTGSNLKLKTSEKYR
ncbi:MAG: hypothetical protein WCY41_01540 [Candidatus Micrarchaeia archaeon]|jgi:hypothetical protein